MSIMEHTLDSEYSHDGSKKHGQPLCGGLCSTIAMFVATDLRNGAQPPSHRVYQPCCYGVQRESESCATFAETDLREVGLTFLDVECEFGKNLFIVRG